MILCTLSLNEATASVVVVVVVDVVVDVVVVWSAAAAATTGCSSPRVAVEMVCSKELVSVTEEEEELLD